LTTTGQFIRSLPLSTMIGQRGSKPDVDEREPPGRRAQDRYEPDRTRHLGLRLLCVALACLLCSVCRTVDMLVQVELTGEYEASPTVTTDRRSRPKQET
jgi:hypothetical protein